MFLHILQPGTMTTFFRTLFLRMCIEQTALEDRKKNVSFQNTGEGGLYPWKAEMLSATKVEASKLSAHHKRHRFPKLKIILL